MKLDPEERIIAAALDQSELDDANERGAGAPIEFKREGDARVTITISRELVEHARALDLTTGELVAEAIRLAVPGAFDLARPHPPSPGCSSGPLPAHCLFDQPDDHHQDASSNTARSDLTDNRANIEATRSSQVGPRSAAD